MPINEILKNVKTVAIIGCSAKQYRTSHLIASYLLEQGFTIIPINPNEEEVLGLKCLNSIKDIPSESEVDIVNIFRNKKYTYEMVQEIVEWSDKTGQKPAIWTQLDVSTDKSKELAEKNDLPYVENRCIMVEHRRSG